MNKNRLLHLRRRHQWAHGRGIPGGAERSGIDRNRDLGGLSWCCTMGSTGLAEVVH